MTMCPSISLWPYRTQHWKPRFIMKPTLSSLMSPVLSQPFVLELSVFFESWKKNPTISKDYHSTPHYKYTNKSPHFHSGNLTLWSAGAPSREASYPLCAMVAGSDQYAWKDHPCAMPHAFICETGRSWQKGFPHYCPLCVIEQTTELPVNWIGLNVFYDDTCPSGYMMPS